jgi:predicted choloylglycine hydrolase
MQFKYSHSSISINNGIGYLKLNEKDYYSTGYAYGKLLVISKNPSVKMMKSVPGKIIFSTLYAITKKHYKNIRIPKEYLEEIRGYSDATGIAYNHLFLLNFGFDVLTRYGFHCSTISFFNKDSVIVGRNTDVPPRMAILALKYAKSLVVDVTIPGKKRFTHVSMPMFVGALNGFNEEGIAVNSHQIRFIKEVVKDGRLSTPLLVRMLLENISDLKSAEYIAKDNITTRALNISVTSKKERKSIILEIHPDKMNVIKCDSHTCCVTHFKSKHMQKLHNASLERPKTRLELMEKLLSKYQHLSYDNLIEILKDHRSGLKYPEGKKSITNEGTFQSFIFDLTNNVIIISNGDKRPVSLTGEYVKIKLAK